MPIVSCKVCSRGFYVKPNRINRGWGKYCSKQCNYEDQKTGRSFACHTCGQLSYKSLKDQVKSKSGKYFCSKSCQTIWRNSVYTGKSHSNWRGGQSAYRNILLRAKIDHVCSRCKNRDTRILIVHHIDRNRKNNSVSNLMWLCHNCHYLVHHYGDEGKKFMVPIA